MVVLISQKTGRGRARTCNSRCYTAKHPQCVCICSGMNHSAGLQKATENTSRAAEQIVKQGMQVRLSMEIK